MDTGATLTLLFAGIGAMTGLLTIYSDWAKRRVERLRQVEAEAALWSLTVKPNSKGSFLELVFQYDAARSKPVTLRGFNILEPQRSDITLADSVRVGKTWSEKEFVPHANWSRQLSLNCDLDARMHLTNAGSGATRYEEYGDYTILARLPEGSATNQRTRLRVLVTIEERSAARRLREIIVTSQEIDGTASSAVRTP